MSEVVCFSNGLQCLKGQLSQRPLYFNVKTGKIIQKPLEKPATVHDLQGKIVAPAYLELQTNGCAGFHFTHFNNAETYQKSLSKVAKYLAARTGVGGFWATVPTVSLQNFKNILPQLRPRTFEGGADLLGAHCEGPWLNPSKKGAHDASLMQSPGTLSAEDVYGASNLEASVRLITLAPELTGSLKLIESMTRSHDIVISLGHSSADYETGIRALTAGAKTLTHAFNAMNPLDHRSPGLAGLVASPESPFFSIIPDGIHLHPATVAMAYRASPEKCILITDSIEMAGMPDGVYPGHAQIPHLQRKLGNKVTIDGSETLIGSCISIDECVRNLQKYSGCELAESVRCVTENVATLMNLNDRGVLEPGRRADFVILDEKGFVEQTWIKGLKVHP